MPNNIILAKELTKHIVIMDTTFSALNLQVLQSTIKADSVDDADANLIIEIASITGTTVSEDFYIKVNLYDDEGTLYLAESHYICASSFSGYDTYSISLYDNGTTLLNAKTARIFATKG